MRNSKKSSKPSMTIAIAAGILVMTLGTPAFAGSSATPIQSAGGLVIKSVSCGQAQAVQAHRRSRSKFEVPSNHLRGAISSLKGILRNLVPTIESSTQPSSGLVDEGTPF